MSKKRFVFSVFDEESESYPYFPFTGKSIADGVGQYIKFISDRDKICPKPTLHWIANAWQDGSGMLRDISPLAFPRRVEISDGLFSKFTVLAIHYLYKIEKYLDDLMLFHKRGVKNEKRRNND